MPRVSQFFWGVSPLIERLLLSYLLEDSLLGSATLASYTISLPQSAFWVPLICKQTSPNVSVKPFCISLHTIALSSLLLGLGRSLQCWFTHAGLSLAPPSPHLSTLSHLTSISTTLHTPVLAEDLHFARSCIQASTKPSTDCPLLLRRIKTGTKVLQVPIWLVPKALNS